MEVFAPARTVGYNQFGKKIAKNLREEAVAFNAVPGDDFTDDERTKVGGEAVIRVQVLQTAPDDFEVSRPPDGKEFQPSDPPKAISKPSHMCFMASTRNPATPRSIRLFRKSVILVRTHSCPWFKSGSPKSSQLRIW